jgi:hypothetical protein
MRNTATEKRRTLRILTLLATVTSLILAVRAGGGAATLSHPRRPVDRTDGHLQSVPHVALARRSR